MQAQVVLVSLSLTNKMNTTLLKDPSLPAEPPLLDQFHNVPRKDMLEYMLSISSCYIDGVGTFHLTNCEGGTFCLLLVRSMAETTIFDNKRDIIFQAGHEVKRFFPVDSSTLVAQFEGNHQLLVLKSNNGWKSITEKLRKPQSQLTAYLGFNTPTQPPNLAAMGNADADIVCSDGKKIPVHAWILASRWPFFGKELAKSDDKKTVELDASEACVQAMLSYFYGGREQLDLETAIEVLIVAEQQKVPGLVSLATRSIFAADMNDQQTMDCWKRARKSSETVAQYCATRMKAPTDDTSSNQDTFTRFMRELGSEDARLFMQMLCPQVAPRA